MSTLNIKKCRAKNFLSVGNQFVDFDLDSVKYTLIVGSNGSGKSTIADSICYALYGKPYRDIKLSQLINSINNKDCLVEIEFDILGVEYKVRRGMKPSIFEIYKNGEMINSEAATRDYQKVLEAQILKMNLKTFRQLVVIGSATHKPFMQLKAGERREIIEDILDIAIFSKMGDISRSTEREFKSDIARLKSEATIRSEALVSHNSNLSSLLADIQTMNETRETELVVLNAKMSEDQATLSATLVDIEDLKKRTEKYDDMKQAERKLTSRLAGLESEISSREVAINKVQNTKACPTCDQDYPEEMRQKLIENQSSGLSEFKNSLDQLRSMSEKMSAKLSVLDADVAELRSKVSDARVVAESIKNTNARIAALNDTTSSLVGLKKLQEAIETTSNLINHLNIDIAENQTELEYYSVISSMLKDSGIKSTIVARYLPIINKLINQYLEQFGLFVGFELSATFEETIRARHRDTYSYNSFSEGEKAKIDCAILMTWRHIAALKSTMNCNLLFLDEVGGQSLDFDSHEQMIRLIGESAQNVFLITHREAEEEFFDRVWEFSKPKNYSQMIERKS